MNHMDRREWLKSAALFTGGSLLSGMAAASNLSAYQLKTKNQPNQIIRLSANENPYGPSERVKNAIVDGFGEACRYPSMHLRKLVDLLAEREGVSRDHIVVTGGSTEGLHATAQAFGWKGGEIVAADPTFNAMLTYAENFGVTIRKVPLDHMLCHDLDKMGEQINGNTKVVFIVNPHNPTGTLLSSERLQKFIKVFESKTIIFSDEAYYDYITLPDYPSMVSFVKEGKNVIVSRTFSKVYGMAGLRIGYLIARPDFATVLRKSVMANTNVPAILGAIEALRDEEFYKYSITKNAEALKIITNTLDELNLIYLKPHTNFVFFKTERPIEQVQQAFRLEGVEIGRPFPPLNEWARISTGKIEDVAKASVVMRKVFSV